MSRDHLETETTSLVLVTSTNHTHAVNHYLRASETSFFKIWHVIFYFQCHMSLMEATALVLPAMCIFVVDTVAFFNCNPPIVTEIIGVLRCGKIDSVSINCIVAYFATLFRE